METTTTTDTPTKSKNQLTAERLRTLANIYDKTTTVDLVQPSNHIFVNNKPDAANLVRAIGGKFVKRTSYGGDYFYYDSQALTGITVAVPRNAVCRKVTPEYECTPLLSPDEEVEVFGEQANQTAA